MSRGRGRPDEALVTRAGRALFAPTDVASLVVFRIAFGLLMAWEVLNYLLTGAYARLYVEPVWLFPFPGFEWVVRLPGDAMYAFAYALVVLALMMAAGLLYRLAAAGFCVGFTYLFLLEQAKYMNHFYLIILLAFWMLLMPAHRAVSLDAWLRPRLRSETIPAWPVWILRVQMGLVYFWAGIAKMNADWLQGWPLRLWLQERESLPLLEEAFAFTPIPVAMSYAGLLLDLFAFPLLLDRRTRPFIFLGLLSFHLWNSQLFVIGVFPWLAITATTIFFDPGWPRRIFRWPRGAPLPDAEPDFHWTPARRALAATAAVWLVFQLLLPIRHWLYPGNPSWTEEGHRFSWHMMLRSKMGIITYVLENPETGETWRVDPGRSVSRRQYLKLATTPVMIHQYAHRLADLVTEDGSPRPRVYVDALVSLNGREPEPIVDPELDLAAIPVHPLRRAPGILPYTKPLGLGWLEKYPMPDVAAEHESLD